jgi:hypothetical protein
MMLMTIQRYIKPVVLVLTIIVLITSSILGFKAWQKSKVIIPPSVKKQVSFAIYWPNKTTLTNDQTTIKYDPPNKFLSFVSTTQNGSKIIISQEATPESFTDIPKVYDKFIAGLQQYSNFDSVNGRVFLVHPKELKGQQTAVMNAKGTLLFMRPDKDISDDTWKQIFNNLDIIR